MGLFTYLMEHSPQARANRVEFAFGKHGTRAGVDLFFQESFGFAQDVVFVGGVMLTRGGSLVSPRTVTSATLGTGFFYDPGQLDPSSVRLYGSLQSRSQDEKSGALAPSVKPKTLRGNSKPSRPTRSGQTSKPFWANGKPKCKKGFSYDFKRKLCVKDR
jgi:hypothetical protein